MGSDKIHFYVLKKMYALILFDGNAFLISRKMRFSLKTRDLKTFFVPLSKATVVLTRWASSHSVLHQLATPFYGQRPLHLHA